MVQDRLKNVQQIQATGTAFAAVLGDGSVVSWGDTDGGGDSSAVQDQLKNVQQIQANDCSFAAILGDGSVVTWTLVVTVVLCRIVSRIRSRSKQLSLLLLPFLAMGRWLSGVLVAMVVTAVLCRTS